jgi:uncharacterized damage-inducible protein DinB
MTYYGAKDLAEAFRTVRKNTLAIAQDIPADKYGFKPTPDTRSVGQLLTHLALSYQFQYQIHAVEHRQTLEGFNFPAMFQTLMAEEQTHRTKDQIIELLQTSGEKWASFLEHLSDAVLAEPVGMPPGSTPPTKSRFEMVMSVKEHEMHHRGQLMLIERLIGIVPHLTRQMQQRMAQAQSPAARA